MATPGIMTWHELNDQNRESALARRNGVLESDIEEYNKKYVIPKEIAMFPHRIEMDHKRDEMVLEQELKEVWE